MDVITICSRISEICKAKGLSIGTVEVKAGLSQGMVSRWRRQGIMPGIDKIIKIAQVLGVSVDYLLGISDDSGGETERQDAWQETDTSQSQENPKEKDTLKKTNNLKRSITFVKGLIYLTERQDIIWRTLTDDQNVFKSNVMGLIRNARKFRFGHAYYAERNYDSFVLLAQWNNESEAASEESFELTLFVLPYSKNPRLICSSNHVLVDLLELTDSTLTEQILSFRADDVQNEIILSLYK